MRIYCEIDYIVLQCQEERQGAIMAAYVYIVECRDGTLYTGWTTDVEKRIKIHNMGKGAKYTQYRHPVVLRYVEAFEEKQEAMRQEYRIKQMDRSEKICLINAANI